VHVLVKLLQIFTCILTVLSKEACASPVPAYSVLLFLPCAQSCIYFREFISKRLAVQHNVQTVETIRITRAYTSMFGPQMFRFVSS
jgi:hypothetical protein